MTRLESLRILTTSDANVSNSFFDTPSAGIFSVEGYRTCFRALSRAALTNPWLQIRVSSMNVNRRQRTDLNIRYSVHFRLFIMSSESG